MSDQGKNDTTGKSSGKRWERGDIIDAERRGRRSAFVEAMEVLRAKGESGLAEWVKRVNAWGGE